MATPSELNDAIEPGSLEYGDRQVVQDRISQIAAGPPQQTPGAASQAAQGRLSQGPVSDLPVTDGLSVGPGRTPAPNPPNNDPRLDALRNLAQHATSPMLRKLARNGLRAALVKGE